MLRFTKQKIHVLAEHTHNIKFLNNYSYKKSSNPNWVVTLSDTPNTWEQYIDEIKGIEWVSLLQEQLFIYVQQNRCF